MENVIRSLTCDGSPPAEYNLSVLLPSLKDLQTSVDKLRELCIPCKLTFDVASLNSVFYCHQADVLLTKVNLM